MITHKQQMLITSLLQTLETNVSDDQYIMELNRLKSYFCGVIENMVEEMQQTAPQELRERSSKTKNNNREKN